MGLTFGICECPNNTEVSSYVSHIIVYYAWSSPSQSCIIVFSFVDISFFDWIYFLKKIFDFGKFCHNLVKYFDFAWVCIVSGWVCFVTHGWFIYSKVPNMLNVLKLVLYNTHDLRLFWKPNRVTFKFMKILNIKLTFNFCRKQG